MQFVWYGNENSGSRLNSQERRWTMNRAKSIFVLILILAIALPVQYLMIMHHVHKIGFLNQNDAGALCIEKTSVVSVQEKNVKPIIERHAVSCPEIMGMKHQQTKQSTDDEAVKNGFDGTQSIIHTVPDKTEDNDVNLQILSITLLDDSESFGDIYFIPEGTDPSLEATQNLHILGNQDNRPLNLVVHSQNENGTESIRFLDWDDSHPNVFTLNGHLGADTSVFAYDGKRQIAQFKLDSQFKQDIQLSVNM
ncbi:hypothetical protein JW948_05565 [bacterium]|nr:hypothetical protein [bacterium]